RAAPGVGPGLVGLPLELLVAVRQRELRERGGRLEEHQGGEQAELDVRQPYFDELRPGLAQCLEGVVVHGRGALALEPLRYVADPQPAGARLPVPAQWCIERAPVPGVRTIDDVEGQRAVRNTAADRSRLVPGPGQRHGPVARDPAEGRPDAR